MTFRCLASWRRGAESARALRAPLCLEPLEERNLLSSFVFVPSPPASGGQLGSAAAIAANDIWAVGTIVTLNQQNQFTYQTLAEHFNGTSWSVVPTSAPVSNPGFSGVAAAASNDVWAVGGGNNGTPSSFIEHWNGTGWSVVSTQANTNLSGVTAPASNNAWAVGTTSGSSNALVEHWDGTSWSTVSSPAFANVTPVAVSADSPNDVWVVGSAAPAFVGPPPSPVTLHWDGQNWSAIPGANFSLGFTFAAVTALSPTNVWADGNSTIPGGEYHKSEGTVEHWDGTSWSVVPLNATTKQSSGTDLHGIAAVSANDVYAVGDNGSQTLVEHWNGTSLQIVNSPNPNSGNGLFGVTALSDGTVAAVGYQENSTFVVTPLILQNAASAPKSWKTATTAAAMTTAMPAQLDAARVDQFFAAGGKADKPGSLTDAATAIQAVATPAASQTVVTLSAKVTVAPGQGLLPFVVQIGAHASGSAGALTGSGFDSPFFANPTGTPGYCRFDVLTGSLSGDVLTLSGIVTFSVDPTLLGIPATITAVVPTGSVTFNFGAIILTGTGSVVVAHR